MNHVDIVDTGLYDCYDPDYVEVVQAEPGTTIRQGAFFEV